MEHLDFNGIERRKFVRLYVPLKLKFTIIEEGRSNEPSRIYNATTKDISINALRMRIEVLHKEAWDKIKNGNSRIELEINLTGVYGVIKISGETLRLSEEGGNAYYMGVIFTGLSEDNKLKLLYFIMTNLRGLNSSTE
jgi:c-di-GMP-binding flagellar brake protein YcgR